MEAPGGSDTKATCMNIATNMTKNNRSDVLKMQSIEVNNLDMKKRNPRSSPGPASDARVLGHGESHGEIRVETHGLDTLTLRAREDFVIAYPGESTTVTTFVAKDTSVDGGRTYERVAPVLTPPDDQRSIDDLGSANKACVENLHFLATHWASECEGLI